MNFHIPSVIVAPKMKKLLTILFGPSYQISWTHFKKNRSKNCFFDQKIRFSAKKGIPRSFWSEYVVSGKKYNLFGRKLIFFSVQNFGLSFKLRFFGPNSARKKSFYSGKKQSLYVDKDFGIGKNIVYEILKHFCISLCWPKAHRYKNKQQILVELWK